MGGKLASERSFLAEETECVFESPIGSFGTPFITVLEMYPYPRTTLTRWYFFGTLSEFNQNIMLCRFTKERNNERFEYFFNPYLYNLILDSHPHVCAGQGYEKNNTY